MTYRLYRNDRKASTAKQLPQRDVFQHCVNGFEGDEAPPSPMPTSIATYWRGASDVYHHDGDDVWRAIETMEECELPIDDQARFLGENARRLYNIKPPKTIIRDRVTELQRPDWWPDDAEIAEALKPESSVKSY